MFLPRALTKGNKNQLKAPPRVTHAIPSSLSRDVTTEKRDTPEVEAGPSDSAKGKSKDAVPNEDYVSAILLALSDYSFWDDEEWAGEVKNGQGGGYRDIEDAGYVPLSRVFERNGTPLEAKEEINVVRALRQYCPDDVEVRMIVADPSSSSGTGGYEVRRREAPTRRYSPDDWDAQTVYLENIPPQYRTVPGVHRLTATCLGGSLTRVAYITSPTGPHDRPRGPSKCRGYALVTLLDVNDAAKLVEAYPWRSRPSTTESEGTDPRSEAARFGLRALSKARWDKLQAEYQERKARVMEEIAAYEDAQLAGIVHQTDTHERASSAQREAAPPEITTTTPATSSGPALDASAPYPYGCLIFVRGVHVETNKTTLKTLFGRAVAGEGIDYVDYAKGMDSCHLRLATPAHAERLHAYFTSKKLSQTSGLDDTGNEGGSESVITTEIVLGRREELYWEKVPAKVRAQAVAKAVGAICGDQSETNGSRPRKRRKR
ncbi:hypothetical protein EV714DRAFT_287780 [Schizophyllum commune]